MNKMTYGQFCKKMLSYEYKSIQARKLADQYPDYYLEFIKLVDDCSIKVINEIRVVKAKRGSDGGNAIYRK